MPKQRDPDLDMLTAIEMRLRENQEEMITLACAACIWNTLEATTAASAAVNRIKVSFGVADIAKLMLTCTISRHFDPDTSEWYVTITRKSHPDQMEITSITETPK